MCLCSDACTMPARGPAAHLLCPAPSPPGPNSTLTCQYHIIQPSYLAVWSAVEGRGVAVQLVGQVGPGPGAAVQGAGPAWTEQTSVRRPAALLYRYTGHEPERQAVEGVTPSPPTAWTDLEDRTCSIDELRTRDHAWPCRHRNERQGPRF